MQMPGTGGAQTVVYQPTQQTDAGTQPQQQQIQTIQIQNPGKACEKSVLLVAASEKNRDGAEKTHHLQSLCITNSSSFCGR